MARRRLDTEMVRRGLCESREKAQSEIAERRVLVSGTIADKPARMVDASEPIELIGPPPKFVSRGGLKLEHAILEFQLEELFANAIVLDAGSSTGGFTDCALQFGAQEVFSVDVGTNQLHESLRQHPRVHVFEKTNLRQLQQGDLPQSATIVVADLSFISLRTVWNNLKDLAIDDAIFIVLVKPQFEAGRTEVAKGKGVITDPSIWQRVLEEISDDICAAGGSVHGVVLSPLAGAEGNREFLLLGRFRAGESLSQHNSLTSAQRTEQFQRIVATVES